jgi:hypothetical protein
MPYIFPNPDGYGASIVYREDTLSEENKARGIKVDSIPQPENIPGKTPVLKADKKTGTVFYEYVDTPEEPQSQTESELEKRIVRLEMLLVEKKVLAVEDLSERI